MGFKKRSVSELIEIAKDIHHGKIFSDRHLRKNDGPLLTNIFLPLAFVGKQIADDIKNGTVALIFEYYDRRMSMSINGYPCFSSMQFLNKKDAAFVFKAIDEFTKSDAMLFKMLSGE